MREAIIRPFTTQGRPIAVFRYWKALTYGGTDSNALQEPLSVVINKQ